MWRELKGYIEFIYDDNPDEDFRKACKKIRSKMEELEKLSKKSSVYVANPVIKNNLSKMIRKNKSKLCENLEELKNRSYKSYSLNHAKTYWLKVKNYLPQPYRTRIADILNEMISTQSSNELFVKEIDDCLAYMNNNK